MTERLPSRFTDRHGRAWTINGSLGLFERVHRETGVDLLDLATTQQSLEQLRSPFTLGHVLYQLLRDEIAARQLTEEQFSEGFDGDVLQEASAALIDEVIFFSPSRIRPILQTIVSRSRAAEERMAAIATSNLDEIARQTDEALERLTTYGANATSSAESSASTPGPGRSAGSPGPSAAGSASNGSKRPRSSRRSTPSIAT